MVPAKDVRAKGVDWVISKLPDAKKYYISIDIDCLDPSIANGTGSPAPFGLYYEEVIPIIEAVTKKGDVVGFDIVEVAPPCDTNMLTAMYAAQIMLDTMTFICEAKEVKKNENK